MSTSLSLTSTDITAGASISQTFAHTSCSGGNVSPALSWTGTLPDGTLSLAITVIDLDASNFVHWALYNVPTTTTALDRAASTPTGATSGPNDYTTTGYGGPCPSSGSVHTYRFQVWALSVADLSAVSGIDTTSATSVMAAISANALSNGSFTATYTGP